MNDSSEKEAAEHVMCDVPLWNLSWTPWSCFQDWALPFGPSLNVKLVIHDPITDENTWI